MNNGARLDYFWGRLRRTGWRHEAETPVEADGVGGRQRGPEFSWSPLVTRKADSLIIMVGWNKNYHRACFSHPQPRNIALSRHIRHG